MKNTPTARDISRMRKDLELGKKNADKINLNIPKYPKANTYVSDVYLGGKRNSTTQVNIVVESTVRFKFKRHYWCTIVRRHFYEDPKDLAGALKRVIEMFGKDVEVVKTLAVPQPLFLTWEERPIHWVDPDQRSDKAIYKKEIDDLRNS